MASLTKTGRKCEESLYCDDVVRMYAFNSYKAAVTIRCDVLIK